MGKCSFHASSFILDRLVIKVAGNQDRHKSSDEFDFRADQTTHFGVTCPWMTKILHFWTWISLRPVGQSWSNFICSITGGGERLQMFWGRLDQNSGVHGNRKPPLTYNGVNGVSTFSWLPLIRSFLYMQVMRTYIKSWTSSNFGQIRPLTWELAALEHLKISHRLIMGKWCLHASSFVFDRIIIKVAGDQDRHKSLVEFNFRPDQTTHFVVTCPWVAKISHFRTWISLKPVGQSWSNFMCSIIGVGERLHKVFGKIRSKLVSMAT